MMGNLASSEAFSFDEATVETLKILFARDGNYVQQLVVEEMVRMADATSREMTGLVVKAAKSNTPSLESIIPQPLVGGLFHACNGESFYFLSVVHSRCDVM